MLYYRSLDEEVANVLTSISRDARAFTHLDIEFLAKRALSSYRENKSSLPKKEAELITMMRDLIAVLSSDREWLEDAQSYSYFPAYEYRDQLEMLLTRVSKPPEYRQAVETVVTALEDLLRQFQVSRQAITVYHQDFESTAYWSLRTDSLGVSAERTLVLLRAIKHEAEDSIYPSDLAKKLDKLLENFEVASVLSDLYAEQEEAQT